jgi:polyhydroxyalkanoate synthesis regulator phasin
MVLDDIRKTFEALIGQLSPEKAKKLAKRYLDPGAAKDQVSKTANDLMDLSQRLRDTVRKEVVSQMQAMGAATQKDVDALRKRVRDLERAVGGSAKDRGAAARKTASRAKATTLAKTTASSRSRKPPAAS